jgi:hypothetical protein
MYCGKYAPWEHYPKNLRFSEVQYPLTVVNQFFDLDWPKGHFENLKTWRYYVINYESFNHERFGPGKLFDTYEATLKLLEALHLLYLDNEDDDRSVATSDKQVNEEKQLWYWFPEKLSPEELMNPYIAVKRVFKEIKPQQFRDYLNEWIHFALSTNAVEDSMSMNEIILVYKSVKKLYSAAWIIKQRETDKPTLKKGPVNEPDIRQGGGTMIVKKTAEGIIRIEQTVAEKLALKEVADAIRKAVPSIKAVIHINSFKDPDTFMLYILIDDTGTPINEDLNKAIEKAAEPLIHIITVIESESILRSRNDDDKAFLRYVLARGVIVQKDEGVKLKERSMVNLGQTEDSGTPYYEQKLTESKMLYDKIDDEIEKENLHEAVKLITSSLTALLEALLSYKTGYKTENPDIDRLSWLTQLFTNEIERRFDQLANAEPELYELIISGQPDYSDEPLDATLPELLKLKIELVNQRMIVRTLMSGIKANDAVGKSK